MQSVQISPDGTRLAMIAGNTREERSVIVVPLEGGDSTRIPMNGERVVALDWFSNDRIGVYIYKYRENARARATYNESRLLLMDVDGGNQKEISPAIGVTNYLSDDPNNVLVIAGATGLDERASRSSTQLMQRTDIYKLNVKSGRATRVQSGRNGTVGWILDDEGKPVIRIDARIKTTIAASGRSDPSVDIEVRLRRYYANIGDGWKLIRDDKTDQEDSDEFWSIAGFKEGERDPYIVGRLNGADKVGLYQMSLIDGEFTGPIFEDERYDLGGTLGDAHSSYLLGYSWTEGEGKRVYWDQEIGAHHAALDAVFPDSEVGFSSWDQSRSKFIISVSGGKVAQNYYLFEPAKGSLSLVAKAYPEVPDRQVHPVQYIDYTARDGLPLTAYLTLPRNKKAENLPLIMLPHGGPEARDTPGFDYWPQFLANLGYAVVQPQFRHSTGFGRKFSKNGYGRWGQEMQTDLSDAINHLADQGIVDRSRVCIFGWSYGGYAAAAGATITPEDYRCAVAGAPVTDLIRMLQYAETTAGVASDVVSYWQKAIGNRFADREKLASMSPARQVENVQAPIMLIHGDIDVVVPIEQSEIMAKALEDAGKPYEFVRLKGENHNILYGETRIEMMEALERFVTTHNPPN